MEEGQGGPEENSTDSGPSTREGNLQPHQKQALGETAHGGHWRGLGDSAKSNMSGALCGQLGWVKAESFFLGLECHTETLLLCIYLVIPF